MSNEGIPHSEYGEAMPSAVQSSDPLATHAPDDSAERADRAGSAGVGGDGVPTSGGEGTLAADETAGQAGRTERAGDGGDGVPTTGAEPPLMGAAELASLAQVSVKSIDRWLKAKKLPAPILIGRQRRWRRREILEWIEAGAPCQREWERLRREKQGA